MEYRQLSILAIAAVAFVLVVGGKASPPAAEIYWKSVLPDVPLPKSIQNLLVPTATGQGSVMPSLAHVLYNRNCRATEGERSKEETSTLSAIFFIYNDLFHHPEKTKRLVIPKSTNNAGFLPHKIAQSTPFSSDKLPFILEKFSVKCESKQAQIMKDTIKYCEEQPLKGEDKHCATSLESMVAFVVSKFGHNKVNILCNTEVEKENKDKKIERTGVKKLGDKQVVCHKMGYIYAVFVCHTLDETEAYMVPVVGDDGSKTKTLAICHTNTSHWDPNYIGFQLLNIKPGNSFCHFLGSDAIVWFS